MTFPDGAPRQLPFPVRAIMGISTLCGIVASVMMLVAVLITCQMIFVRSVLNQSTVWQTEVVIYLMIAATLIGLPYVQKLRGHVGVDLLPTLLPQTMRRGLAIATLVITALMIAIMLWYGFDMWHFAYERGWKSETVLSAPLWIPYLAIPVGFFLFLLQLLADLWLSVTAFPMDAKGLPAIGPEMSEDY
ncbi:TRAP-type C4-dicarboxylate transport system, small permease component [Loktanella atrilutea]|uniref:TRAP transporter small permease protein n=2 Tax=Loktanella atrilutea TaxID=366533 RepID=A0A1M5E0Y5_LOKAT|nr:TRAP-type C4-dicarboxylate transport system, small permease component [Loktanella atrilutea]